ncbi:MAG TPA: hydrogenase nickel incorporation protein HypB [Dehalococcoidia bacterium]|jgi:hydrogenase nickel incorporation protein HypB|nr:hydrogenase nickel incorporation protein HypB [Dehalococcoidia bacterium]
MKIKVLKDILDANEQLAERNRQLLDSNSVFAVNLLSSPGAGKTSLILATIKSLKGEIKIGVIEGDVSSSLDAEVIGKEGVPVLQINTGGGCHLDANMAYTALNNLPLKSIELLLIENVGNLICPAEFALGEHKKVLISSIPEGDDKPFKYPLMFHKADAVLINKIDLLPYLKFDIQSFSQAIKAMNQAVEIFQISCATGQRIQEWISWLLIQLSKR